MSKDGPPASSFTEPRLTGYLTKQSGQGFASNWRKRFFVLDSHYLFYYKSHKDAKPVGVVCLSDYKFCRKASTKESKKNKNTFMIEKHDDAEDADYTVRNYYIFAENEIEMKNWIDAITLEIQPFESRLKKGPKVDTKAFDELSGTGVKLSHPTAARPKPQGRRPPRKYTPFHEDEDSSPKPKRPLSQQSALEDYHSSSPTRSVLPQLSEEAKTDIILQKRGYQPLVPLKPVIKDEESPTGQEQSKQATPTPPAPPPSSAKPKSKASVKPITPPPPEVNTEQQTKQTASADNELIKTKPQPSSKPVPPPTKPVPPPTKPKKRSNTDLLLASGKTAVEEDTKKDNDLPSVNNDLLTVNNKIPVSNERRTNSFNTTEKKFNKPPPPPTKLRKGQSLTETTTTTATTNETTTTTNEITTNETTTNETTTTTQKPKPKPRTKLTRDDQSSKSIDLCINEIQTVASTIITEEEDKDEDMRDLDASLKDIEQFIQEVKNDKPIVEQEDNPTVRKISYENVTVNVKQNGQLTLSAPVEDQEEVGSTTIEEQRLDDLVTDTVPIASDEIDLPTIDSPTPPTEGIYDMPTSSDNNTTDPVYDTPTSSLVTVNDTTDPVYDTPTSSPVTLNDTTDPVYDMPSPVNNQLSVDTTVAYDVPISPVSGTPPPETTPTVKPGRLSLIENDYDLPTTFGITVDSPPNEEDEEKYVPPERDALGYAMVNKKQSIKLTNKQQQRQQQQQVAMTDSLALHVSVPEDITSVPENLQKAKEILRLAMIVKTEVLEMRREVESELALARRERHDSQLMKQNAAEILKMAKEVLQRASS